MALAVRLAICRSRRYVGAMKPSPNKKATAAKLRSWRVSILRQRAQYLGTVRAPDGRTAEAAAVSAFDLQ